MYIKTHQSKYFLVAKVYVKTHLEAAARTASTLRLTMLCVGIFKSPWMVVAACFVLQIYSVGSEYTFGLLNIQILNEFDMSTSEVAWIGSIQMAVFFFTGKYKLAELTPLFNPLTCRPGCMPGSRYTGVGVLFFVI